MGSRSDSTALGQRCLGTGSLHQSASPTNSSAVRMDPSLICLTVQAADPQWMAGGLYVQTVSTRSYRIILLTEHLARLPRPSLHDVDAGGCWWMAGGGLSTIP